MTLSVLCERVTFFSIFGKVEFVLALTEKLDGLLAHRTMLRQSWLATRRRRIRNLSIIISKAFKSIKTPKRYTYVKCFLGGILYKFLTFASCLNATFFPIFIKVELA